MWQNQGKAFITILPLFEESIQKRNSVEDPSSCFSDTLHSKNELKWKKEMKEAHRKAKTNAGESKN